MGRGCVQTAGLIALEAIRVCVRSAKGSGGRDDVWRSQAGRLVTVIVSDEGDTQGAWLICSVCADCGIECKTSIV